ncbi:MAG: transglycosylase SLT domain-containing protein [Thermoanaerobaculales bacterium]
MHASRWAEVRTISEAFPRPLPPAVVLATARAARVNGEPRRTLKLLRPAIPRAGDLAAALRLEAAEAALALNQDPSAFLAPLVSRNAPAAHRHAAAHLLRRASAELPLEKARHIPRARLPRPLQRAMTLTLAVRNGDVATALRALEAGSDDQSTLRAALFLVAQPSLPAAGRLAVAQSLMAGGEWRRSQELLASIASPNTPALRERWAFLRGRAAYRLGELEPAAQAFGEAFSVATSSAGRFAAAVQRARVAELQGDLGTAAGFWDAARTAAPLEVEGWDGGARTRAALGRADDALSLLRRAPAAAVAVASPRLAALLLARGEVTHSREALAMLPPRAGVTRLLRVVAHLQSDEVLAARDETTALLADPHAGAWRELVLSLLPAVAPSSVPPPACRSLDELAPLAATWGAEVARRALEQTLASDPAWAGLLRNELPEPATWRGPARDLVEVGLEREAAAIYPQAFPSTTPADLAWTARRLAAWGNHPAALSAGEQLWAALDDVPATLLPDALLPRILPDDLVSACLTAAAANGVPPSWLVALVRQESRFDQTATSAAGAVGIAQFIPDVARRLGADPAALADPQLSLALAAQEARRLACTFGPRLAVAAAAYNAGDAVVTSWLTLLGANVSEALFAAAIPYRETSNYVLAVVEGAALARHLTDVCQPESTLSAPTASRLEAWPAASAMPPRR